jgi:hypothetical protein
LIDLAFCKPTLDDTFHRHARIPLRLRFALGRLALARRVRHFTADAERAFARTEHHDHHDRAGAHRQRGARVRATAVRRRAVSADAV